MVFSSNTFLFAFLPLVLLGALLAPRALRNVVLLVASLVFYAWGEGVYVALMLSSIAFNYAAGLAVDRTRGGGAGKLVLGLAVAVNLAVLGVFKYANFVADNVAWLLDVELKLEPVHLPIGISFFTFQALSYLVDVYRGEAAVQRRPLDLALYIAMFPQLIAGPIVRYHDVARQLVERVVTRAGFAEGVRRFVIGLAKKVLIANVVGEVADRAFALPGEELSTLAAWTGVVAYALQIYFDFSGYSDMAIGLGLLFGFRFLENFRHPYVAVSIQDFWRRWHVSLSSWFRDYLYIPLGGSRGGPLRTYRNLLIVFFLCGLWHGPSWSFVVWGLWHGLFLVLERRGLALPRVLGHGYTLMVVLIGWVFFRAETLGEATRYLGAMFAGGGADPLPLSVLVNREVLLAFAAGAVGSVPWFERWRPGAAAPGPALRAARAAALGALFTVTLHYLAASTYNPFIYFRF